MDSPPIIADRYEPIQFLGRGAFGSVWRALDRKQDQFVAIKLLKSRDPGVHARFAVEARLLERLRHPHCVGYLDHGNTPKGQPYLVLDLVPGVSLSRWLRTDPDVDSRRIVAGQIADAIRAAHRVGIVHRDLKPGNILVHSGTEGPYATVLDFGLGKLRGDGRALTATGEFLGTPGFMSPEQIQGGAIGHASDVYALGVVFFFLFADTAPFANDAIVDLCMAHVHAPAPICAAAPEDLQPLISRMLSKRPSERPSIVQVSRVVRGEHQAELKRKTPGPSRMLAGAVVLAAIVAVVVLTRSDRVSERTAPPAKSTNSRRLKPKPATITHQAPLNAYRPDDLTEAASSLFIFHDDGATARRELEAWRVFADHHGIALVSVQPPVDAAVPELRKRVELATNRFDLDPERRLAFGFGLGNAVVHAVDRDDSLFVRIESADGVERERLESRVAAFLQTGHSVVTVPDNPIKAAAYVPTTASELRSAVFVFLDWATPLSLAAEYPPFLEMAEKHGTVLVLMHDEDPVQGLWDKHDREHVPAFVDSAVAQYSLRPDALFALGFGPGGRAAELSCDESPFRAFAVSGYARPPAGRSAIRSHRDSLCSPKDSPTGSSSPTRSARKSAYASSVGPTSARWSLVMSPSEMACHAGLGRVSCPSRHVSRNSVAIGPASTR